MTAPVLAAADLVAGYEPDLPILKGASVHVMQGEIVAILGPNGAGKSTLIKAVAGLVPVASGRVTLAGADITGHPPHTMARRRLAFVPQTENVFARMTVEENLLLAGFMLTAAGRRGRLDAMYAFFPDLFERRRLPAGRLSGGQRQMVAIARALMVEPAVLMLDEPSAGLSPRLVETVFAKLGDIRASGVTVLLVEQNVRAALAIGDRAYVLVDGKERHEAPASVLMSDNSLARLYLGAHAAPGGEGAPA